MKKYIIPSIIIVLCFWYGTMLITGRFDRDQFHKIGFPEKDYWHVKWQIILGLIVFIGLCVLKIVYDFNKSGNKKIYAPFDHRQVKALNEFQQLGFHHQYTCGSPDQPNCERRNGTGDGTLTATEDGWVCPCGRYTQNWADAFLLDTEKLKKDHQNWLDNIGA